MASRYYVIVEGHGEIGAAHNLVTRLWQDLGLPFAVWAEPIRWKNLTSPEGVRQACDFLRTKTDAAGALLLRDDEDGCPKDDGPEVARWIREANLPFPSAVALFFREYETLFLTSVASLAGQPIGTGGTARPGIVAGTTPPPDPQAIRGAKEWLTARYPQGRAYKPTLDQLALTRLVSFETLRARGLPCFGTLERALGFLPNATPGGVYPPQVHPPSLPLVPPPNPS